MADLVKIILDADNKASGPIDDVSKSLGALGSVAGGALKLGLAAGAAALAGMTAALGFAIKGAMESELAVAQLDATLRSTGKAASDYAATTEEMRKELGLVKPAAQMSRDELLKYADAMRKVTRYDDEVVLGGESLLLTFTSIGKDVFPDAMEVAMDMSTVFGTDLQGSITQVGKALQDPILGITALRRVGVNFNAAQTEVIKKMVETGDVAGAQAAILKELKAEFGGSAKAAGQTFAGQLDILKNALGDVAEEAGKPLLDPLKDLAAAMLTLVQSPGFVDLTEGFVRNILKGVDAVKELWKAFQGGGVSGGLDALLGLAQGGKPVTGGGEKAGAQEGFGSMVPTGLIGAGEAADIKALFGDLVDKWNELKPGLLAFKEWLDTTLPEAAANFKLFWDANVLPPFDYLWRSISDEETGLLPALKILGTWLAETLPGALDELSKAFGVEKGRAGQVRVLKGELTDFVAPAQGFIDLLTAIDKALWLVTDAITASYDAAHALWNMLTDIFMTFPGYLNTGGLHFAGGTSFAPGGMAMVGERGPELMYVPRGSRIWPHGAGPGMASGGGGAVTLVYSPMISLATEDEITDKLLPLLRKAGVRL